MLKSSNISVLCIVYILRASYVYMSTPCTHWKWAYWCKWLIIDSHYYIEFFSCCTVSKICVVDKIVQLGPWVKPEPNFWLPIQLRSCLCRKSNKQIYLISLTQTTHKQQDFYIAPPFIMDDKRPQRTVATEECSNCRTVWDPHYTNVNTNKLSVHDTHIRLCGSTVPFLSWRNILT